MQSSTDQEQFLRTGLKRDKVFAMLWAGERRNGNESADDQAFMNKLAYWCNADPAAQSHKTKTQITDEHAEIMRHFVTGIDCQAETAREEILAVKAHFGKTDGVVAYHGYQSFAPEK